MRQRAVQGQEGAVCTQVRSHTVAGGEAWGSRLIPPPSIHSLQQPFRGEYLGLTQNRKYQKLQAVAKDKLVMAEAVQKVNRANGKVSPVPWGVWGRRRAALTAPQPTEGAAAAAAHH